MATRVWQPCSRMLLQKAVNLSIQRCLYVEMLNVRYVILPVITATVCCRELALYVCIKCLFVSLTDTIMNMNCRYNIAFCSQRLSIHDVYKVQVKFDVLSPIYQYISSQPGPLLQTSAKQPETAKSPSEPQRGLSMHTIKRKVTLYCNISLDLDPASTSLLFCCQCHLCRCRQPLHLYCPICPLLSQIFPSHLTLTSPQTCSICVFVCVPSVL